VGGWWGGVGGESYSLDVWFGGVVGHFISERVLGWLGGRGVRDAGGGTIVKDVAGRRVVVMLRGGGRPVSGGWRAVQGGEGGVRGGLGRGGIAEERG